MAKSIRHWLIATNLARPIKQEKTNRPILERTEFGDLVWEHDPYFVEKGTWWMLHINLVNKPEIATSWAWFFNNFTHDRFDRAVCLESLRRRIEMTRKKPPSTATLERDLGCLLLSYARTIPAQTVDPEDGADSPFRELGLLSHFKSSGSIRSTNLQKQFPFQFLVTRSPKRSKIFDLAKSQQTLPLERSQEGPVVLGGCFA